MGSVLGGIRLRLDQAQRGSGGASSSLGGLRQDQAGSGSQHMGTVSDSGGIRPRWDQVVLAQAWVGSSRIRLATHGFSLRWDQAQESSGSIKFFEKNDA